MAMRKQCDVVHDTEQAHLIMKDYNVEQKAAEVQMQSEYLEEKANEPHLLRLARDVLRDEGVGEHTSGVPHATYGLGPVLMENAADHVARLVDAPAEDVHLDRRQRHEPLPVCALLGRSAAARYEDEVACHTGGS